ncbi:MAG: IS982 family transposase [Anaerolineales bacterium]
MDSLLELFCDVDDFCQAFLPQWNHHLLSSGQRQRQRNRSLTTSEIMTILIAFHQSHYRDFKAYYNEQVVKTWHAEFPGLVSYTRFVEYIPSVLVPLTVYLQTCCLGQCSGISFIDSTSLDVCLNQRIHCHKVFAGLAERGKTSTGWFFGFKLHLVVNERGEILQFCITPGNVDDRKPVPKLAQRLFGKLFGDKGYVSQQLAQQLREMFNVQLITKLRANMKNQLMLLSDRLLLRRRAIIETIIDQLKNISQIEHSRHRSVTNFFVNVLWWFDCLLPSSHQAVAGLGQLSALARLTRTHVKLKELN